MAHRPTSQRIAKRPRSGFRSSIAALGLLVGFFVIYSGSGCGGSLGGECILDSDCDEPLVCVYQFCHTPCKKSLDCHIDGEVCLRDNEGEGTPHNYCDKPTACAVTAECGNARVCDYNVCRDDCTTDSACLGGQRCFHGGCRDETDEPDGGWDAPAELGAPCSIHSNCRSKNCSGICVGCEADFDCGGDRMCDPAEVNNTGMCTDTTLSAKVTQIDVGNYRVVDAIPNSTGSTIYFITAEPSGNYGVFKIELNDEGLAKGSPPFSLCPSVPLQPRSISISTDDSVLFVSSFDNPAGIWRLGTNVSLCDNLMLVAWTQNHAAWAIDVYEESGSDTIYLAELDLQMHDVRMYSGSIYAADPSSTILEAAEWQPRDLAVGEDRAFVLTAVNQLGVAEKNESIASFKTNLGVDLPDGVALNYAEDTVYVSGSNQFQSQYHIVAINAADPSDTQRYSMDAGWRDSDGIFAGGLNRAQNANIFSWVTRDGRLYRFEPN